MAEAPKENVIFLGPPGVGKTHLAISLAIAAAEHGRRVYSGTLVALLLTKALRPDFHNRRSRQEIRARQQQFMAEAPRSGALMSWKNNTAPSRLTGSSAC